MNENEVGLAQLSNRVVAVTDEELLLVEMQHICRCRYYQIGICCANHDIYVLLCQNRVEYENIEYREFSIPGGVTKSS